MVSVNFYGKCIDEGTGENKRRKWVDAQVNDILHCWDGGVLIMNFITIITGTKSIEIILGSTGIAI